MSKAGMIAAPHAMFEQGICGNKMQTGPDGVADCIGKTSGGIKKQTMYGRTVPLDRNVKPHRTLPLGVQINQQYPSSLCRKLCCKVDRSCCFAGATFAIGNHDYFN